MHGHWGLEACVTDYVRPVIFGETIPKISHGLLLLVSATTLGGLLYFIYTDIGIANAIRKLWAIKGQWIYMWIPNKKKIQNENVKRPSHIEWCHSQDNNKQSTRMFVNEQRACKFLTE